MKTTHNNKNYSMAMHVGYVHWGCPKLDTTKEKIYRVIDELNSDKADEFRKILIDDMIGQLQLSDEQVIDTLKALENKEWWYTIGGPDMSVTDGVDMSITPHERWLNSKNLKFLSNDTDI